MSKRFKIILSNKKQRSALMISCLLLLTGCGQQSLTWTERYSSAKLQDSALLIVDTDHTAVCTVAEAYDARPIVLSPEYILEWEQEQVVTNDGLVEQRRDTVFNVTIRNMAGQEIYAYTLEDFKALRQDEDFHFRPGGITYQGGGDFPYVALFDYKDEAQYEQKDFFYLNLNTGELSLQNYADWQELSDWTEEELEYKRRASAIDEKSLIIYAPVDTKGAVRIQIRANRLEDNPVLYERFPGLEDYRGREGYRTDFLFMDFQEIEDIVALFDSAGRGTNLFSDAHHLYEYETLDGEAHDIKTCEEWDRWYRLRVEEMEE